MPQLTNENNAQSVFGTVPHDLHRFRRDALSPFFSKASVAKLDPLIQSKVRQLCSQMEKHAGSGKPVSISMAFSCMTTDVVTEFAFTRTYNFLDSESFEPNFHKAIAAATEMGPVDLRAQIREIKGRTESAQYQRSKAHRTIFEELVDSNELPEREKSVERLWQEGQIIIGAGTETTAWSA
ncbi:MAG: hypothetical protein Q9161_008488 [Pseudevernia consocians]